MKLKEALNLAKGLLEGLDLDDYGKNRIEASFNDACDAALKEVWYMPGLYLRMEDMSPVSIHIESVDETLNNQLVRKFKAIVLISASATQRSARDAAKYAESLSKIAELAIKVEEVVSQATHIYNFVPAPPSPSKEDYLAAGMTSGWSYQDARDICKRLGIPAKGSHKVLLKEASKSLVEKGLADPANVDRYINWMSNRIELVE